MADTDDISPLKPGDRFGDYTVERLLGKGGMGTVYLMRTPGGAPFAVKIMHRGRMSHDLRVRFAREAEFAMKIRHKNLISVYDVGEDPDSGLCYIIMDYIPGGTLTDRLRESGAIPVCEAVKIATHVAAALDVAHKRGLVHRDVKPDNIMFAADGTPKLADLGIAKFGDDNSTMVTTTGMIIGTPAYMSPEQLIDSHNIDARSDIYSLGVVLYEMLSGERPNSGSSSAELLAKAIKGEPLPDIRTTCPNISASIAHVISLMCAPKPADRPSTSMEVSDLLRRASTGRLVLPKKKPRVAIVRKAWQTIPAAAVMGSVAGLLFVLCYMFAHTPSRISVPGECDAQPQEVQSATNDIVRVPASPMDSPAPQVNVVTQFVETIREVLKTVVVTASEDSAKAEIAQQCDVVEDTEKLNPEPAVAVASAGEIDRTVCGIRLEGEPGMTNELERLSTCIALADDEVRKFMPFEKGERVQSSIDTIRIVKSCGSESGWGRNGKLLEVGLDVVADDARLEDLVSNFMTSHRDRRAVEPFEKEMYRYIRYRVWDGIATARGRTFGGGHQSEIKASIDFCRTVRRKYGRNDYNGQLLRYGSRRQVVPRDKISRNREGKVFWILHIAESIEKTAILRYFMLKDQAVAKRKLNLVLSASDFAALMSNAVGRDLFHVLSNDGWNVDSFLTNVKVRRMPKAELFGE